MNDERFSLQEWARDLSVANLLNLHAMLPKEGLSTSSPVGWLEAAEKELSSILADLEEARFQTYTNPTHLPSLERACDTIAEERAFVNGVLNGDSLRPIVERTETRENS